MLRKSVCFALLAVPITLIADQRNDGIDGNNAVQIHDEYASDEYTNTISGNENEGSEEGAVSVGYGGDYLLEAEEWLDDLEVRKAVEEYQNLSRTNEIPTADRSADEQLNSGVVKIGELSREERSNAAGRELRAACNNIYITTSNRWRQTTYWVWYYTPKLWVNTDTFIGTADDPYACGKKPYISSKIRHMGVFMQEKSRVNGNSVSWYNNYTSVSLTAEKTNTSTLHSYKRRSRKSYPSNCSYSKHYVTNFGRTTTINRYSSNCRGTY